MYQRPSNSNAGASGSILVMASIRSESALVAARRHRILGSRFAGGRAATSAIPIGFPTRV